MGKHSKHTKEKEPRDMKAMFSLIVIVLIAGISITGYLLIKSGKIVISKSGVSQNIVKSAVVDNDAIMTDLATSYYESNIKGKVLNVNISKITVADLEQAGLDVSKLQCSKEDSYALVIVANPNETDLSKISYTVKPHVVPQN